MSGCEFSESPAVELYFYGELDAEERARVDAHLRDCFECRQRLQDLHAIRDALALRPQVDAPAAGDWSGFMRRLDAACGIDRQPIALTSPRRPTSRWMPALAFAATIALVTIGILVTARYRAATDMTGRDAASASIDAPSQQANATPTGSPSMGSAPGRSRARAASLGRSLVEQSEEHLERSKLVVLGLASRDPRTAASDWEYERQLAGTLLSDTRLYRLAAQSRGMSDLARVMGDLETVLLEASLSDQKDPEALDRLQRLIRKRDLVLKMQVVGSAAGI